MIVVKINEATGNFGITVILLSAIIAVINILLKEITKNAPISGITGIMTKGAEGEEINKQDIKKMVRYSAAQIIKLLWFIESIKSCMPFVTKYQIILGHVNSLCSMI